MTRFRIATIPGDGIGQEVIPAGQRVLDAAAAAVGASLIWIPYGWGCARYRREGTMMPADGLDVLREHDAIYLGAVGWPGVPDHVSLWGLLIPIRRGFQQYASVRPVTLMPGVRSPLADFPPRTIDMVIVRENTEGEYSTIGGRMGDGTSDEMVMQETVFTRRGVDRLLRYAFDLARARPRKRLTSATKSNGIAITMPYWDERVRAMAAQYPDVTVDQYHIDILTAHFVQRPDAFDVVVGSNLFGDILSDLGPACAGTIGIAPSANLNPERTHPSMFEPVHGSAPDIAGQGIANPIGAIWAGAMLLDHLGAVDAAALVMQAIRAVLADPLAPRTRDLGGAATTVQVTDAIVRELLSA
ncbi:MAG: tartrate dehydrogenase [Gemmatimonadaceae bacterium]|nr:tartrate dehydrogenase [Gemmatimonadaceae bacterium]